MFKRYVIFILTVVGFNVSAMDIFKYIPTQSKIRDYCKKSFLEDKDVQELAKFLKAMESSRERLEKIEAINTKLNKLEDLARVQKNKAPEFEAYYVQQKAKYTAQIEQVIGDQMLLNVDFPMQGNDVHKKQYQGVKRNLLNKVRSKLLYEPQEIEYLKMAFSNAWHHKHPWNTKTSTEKIKAIGKRAVVVLVGLGLANCV